MNKESKEYYTEPQQPQGCNVKALDKEDPAARYSALTRIAEVPESSNRDSTFVSNHPSFSFEKDKLHHLNIGPSYQTDVNDENVQKLKDDILKQCQNAIEEFDKYSALLKAISITLLSFNIIEIIASFFLLLILSMQYIPPDQILIWIGLTMLLCLAEIYVSIKAINASQDKNIDEMRAFICNSKVFACIFFASCVFLMLCLDGVIAPTGDALTEDQKRRLGAVQGVLFVLTFLKFVAQVVFFSMGEFLKKRLQAMAGEDGVVQTS